MDITKARVRVSVRAELWVWMAVHGNLCLALRHPQNTGPSRVHGIEGFVCHLGKLLVEHGILTAEELAQAENFEKTASAQPMGEDS